MPTSPWDIIKKAVIPMMASAVVNGVEKKQDRTSTNPEGLSGLMNILSGGNKRRRRGYKRRRKKVRKHK